MGTIFQKIKDDKINSLAGLRNILNVVPSTGDVKTYIESEGEDVQDFFFESKVKIDVKDKYLRFNNCVFFDDVKVTLLKDNSRIEFSNCILNKNVIIQVFAGSENKTMVDIRNCNIEELTVISKISDFSISYSTINYFKMRCKSELVFLDRNIINHFMPTEGVSEKGDITFLNNQFKCLFEEKENIDLLKDPGVKKHDMSERTGKNIVKSNFYDAVITHSDLKYNRNIYAKYLYKKRLYSASNWLGMFFVIVTGGFCYPLLFIFYLLIVVFAFGCTYYEIGKLSEYTTTFWHAMYYSGITFTTLGYGEIAEYTHWAIKALSVFEAFLGVILSSGFLTAIINKYSN